MFCRPPTSPLSVVGHRRDGHRPELRGERADAQPDEEHRDDDDRGGRRRCRCRRAGPDARQHQEEAERAPRAAATPSASTLGTPTAATSRATDSGMIRTPVSMRGEPEHHGQEQRDDEEHAGLQQELEEEHDQAAGRAGGSAASPDARAAPARSLRGGPARGRTARPRAARRAISQNVGEMPEQRRARRASAHPAPLARAQHAEHRQPEADHREDGADEVEAGLRPRRGVGDPAGQDQDHDHDDAPRRRTPSATRRRWWRPADERAGGDGDGARGRDEAVGLRAARAAGSSPATSATIAGRISAAPTPSRNDQPKSRTGRLGASAGGERAAAVDHAADGERPLAPDDRADLAAGDHERGHDERVQRDGASGCR